MAPSALARRSACVALAAALAAVAASAACPNLCSGHGRCVDVSRCECYGGWAGGDCSQRTCPTGRAWVDIATGTDVAHGLAECSNIGRCDGATGQCDCAPGYEGLACNRMKCPEGCYAHGQCVSMRQYASMLDRGVQLRPYYTYGSAMWDSDAIYGCACDAGFSGWECGERMCPHGDDPLTAGQADEVQVIVCIEATGPPVVDLYTLSFRGATTRPFPPSVRADELKAKLEELPTIGQVTITYTAGFSLCNPARTNAASITFITDHGDVPDLVVQAANGGELSGAADNNIDLATDGESLTYVGPTGATLLATSATGTKENVPCSGRGRCSRLTGECACFVGYGSSDGLGRRGVLPNCGAATMPITSCPGSPECSGHGTCSGSPDYRCVCHEGWQGGDCFERSCPSGPAWFDYPSAVNVAHGVAECSNRGRCDRRTGQCMCQEMFEGAACERMTCPGSSPYGRQVCSGHGRCLSMRALARTATVNGDATPQSYGDDPNNAATWDGDSIFGCLCDAGYTGYDCSQRTCLAGDDITLKEANPTLRDEEQTLTCTLLPTAAGGPRFRLRFRQAETGYLSPGITAAALRAELEALPTVGTIGVSYSLSSTLGSSAPACGTYPSANTITFAFATENGDVPPIQVIMSEGNTYADGSYYGGDGWVSTDLEFSGGDPARAYAQPYLYQKLAPNGYIRTGIRTLETAKGTSGNAECSARGVCDRDTGVCDCFPGFGASDGSRGPGAREDCGWREPVVLRGVHRDAGGPATRLRSRSGGAIRHDGSDVHQHFVESWP